MHDRLQRLPPHATPLDGVVRLLVHLAYDRAAGGGVVVVVVVVVVGVGVTVKGVEGVERRGKNVVW